MIPYIAVNVKGKLNFLGIILLRLAYDCGSIKKTIKIRKNDHRRGELMGNTGSDSGLGSRRPLTKEQIARRTVTREEVAMWTSEFKQDNIRRMQYWESKETVDISQPGDLHLIFAGRWEDYTAKVWTIRSQDGS